VLIFLLEGLQLKKPDALTTHGQFNSIYHKYSNNKHLIPAKDGQFTPVKGGQNLWLFQEKNSFHERPTSTSRMNPRL
jgi:hypothetical protein